MNWLITILCIMITLNVKASSPNLCQVNEQVMFACATQDNKIISLCASRYLDANKSYLQYRFGTSSAIELQYPSVKLLPAQAFKGRSQQLKDGQGVYLRFQNNDYDYIIYSGASKEWAINGVIILKNTEFKQYIACKNKPDTHLLPSLLTTLTIANDNDNRQFFISDIPASILKLSTPMNNLSASELTTIKQCYSTAITPIAVNRCSIEESTYYEKKLTETYHQVIATIKINTQQSFIEAQSAWLIYRNKECNFVSLQNKTHLSQRIKTDGCYVTFNQKRIRDLERYIKLSNH